MDVSSSNTNTGNVEGRIRRIQELMASEFDYVVDRQMAEQAVDEAIVDYAEDPEWYEDFDECVYDHIHDILYPDC